MEMALLNPCQVAPHLGNEAAKFAGQSVATGSAEALATAFLPPPFAHLPYEPKAEGGSFPGGVERFGPARMGVGAVREPPLLSLVPIRR